MTLIDSHCHFDDPRFDRDRERLYVRARDAGVVAQIVPAVTRDNWERVRQTCRRYPGLYPAYGLHPMFMAAHRDDHPAALGRWLDREAAVAVGECGLDFFIDDPHRARQEQLFEQQVILAVERNLPLIVHARRAVEQVIGILRRHPACRGVLHSFSGSRQQALRLMEMGFLMSFGGAITYDRATRLRRLVAGLPLEYLMLETDAPDQPDAGIRGQRNEPARLPAILSVVAELREEPREQIADITTRNAERLFGLPPTETAASPASPPPGR